MALRAPTVTAPFTGLDEAGRLLAAAVARLALAAQPVVVALGAEALPVARPVGERLGAPVEECRAARLVLPWRPAIAFGAITAGSHHYLDRKVVTDWGLGAREIARLGRELLPGLRAGSAPSLRREACEGASVVVVARSLSTGYRVRAAAAAAHAAGGAEVLIASPCASRDAADSIAAEHRLVTLLVSDAARFDPADYYPR